MVMGYYVPVEYTWKLLFNWELLVMRGNAKVSGSCFRVNHPLCIWGIPARSFESFQTVLCGSYVDH